MDFLYRQGVVSIYRDDKQGLCVVVNKDVRKDRLLYINAVGFIGFDALKEDSKFNDYPMYWNSKTDCISFGVINLLNHAECPSVYIVRDRKKNLMKMYAGRNLKKGEECTIHYACKLWFDVV